MIELKECPFCGGGSEVMRSVKSIANMTIKRMESDEVTYWVKCLDCQVSSWSYDDKESAIKHWNKRKQND